MLQHVWKRRRLNFTAGLRLLLLIAFGLQVLVQFYNFTQTDFDVEPDAGSQKHGGQSGPRILLVSAFFPLSRAKHSPQQYAGWLANFFGPVETDMYIYTSNAFRPQLKSLLRSAPLNGNGQNRESMVHIETSLGSPMDAPPLERFRKVAAKQWEMDRERAYHSPELYAVWDAKAFMLADAARKSPGYDYYFWQDAGSMRKPLGYRQWPDPNRIQFLFSRAEQSSDVTANELILMPFWREPTQNEKDWNGTLKGPLDSELSEGSFFGGRIDAVKWFESTFYSYLDQMLQKGHFVGKDQTLYNAIVALHPAKFFGPVASKVSSFSCFGDRWFYYMYWVASREERRRMRMQLQYLWRTRCQLLPIQFPFH